MSEHAPKPFKVGFNKVTLEANVKMPQHNFAIVLSGSEHIVASDDPKAALAHLIEPHPINAALEERTKKANAQHVHNKIDRVLTAQQIQNLDLQMNASILAFLGSLFGEKADVPKLYKTIDREGDWVSELGRELAASLEEKFTPEILSFLRELFAAVSAAMNGSDIKEILESYRNNLIGKTQKAFPERDEVDKETKRILREFTDAIRRKVEAHFEQKELNRTEEIILTRMIDKIAWLEM